MTKHSLVLDNDNYILNTGENCTYKNEIVVNAFPQDLTVTNCTSWQYINNGYIFDEVKELKRVLNIQIENDRFEVQILIDEKRKTVISNDDLFAINQCQIDLDNAKTVDEIETVKNEIEVL